MFEFFDIVNVVQRMFHIFTSFLCSLELRLGAFFMPIYWGLYQVGQVF